MKAREISIPESQFNDEKLDQGHSSDLPILGSSIHGLSTSSPLTTDDSVPASTIPDLASIISDPT